MTDKIIMKANWPYWPYVDRDNNAMPHGWAGEKSYPNTTTFELHCQMYNDIVCWLYECVENTKQNAHWAKLGDCIYVRLRKRKDLMMFVLRWGT